MGDDQGSTPTSGADEFPSAAPGGGMTVEECQGYIQKSFRSRFSIQIFYAVCQPQGLGF